MKRVWNVLNGLERDGGVSGEHTGELVGLVKGGRTLEILSMVNGRVAERGRERDCR